MALSFADSTSALVGSVSFLSSSLATGADEVTEFFLSSSFCCDLLDLLPSLLPRRLPRSGLLLVWSFASTSLALEDDNVVLSSLSPISTVSLGLALLGLSPFCPFCSCFCCILRIRLYLYFLLRPSLAELGLFAVSFDGDIVSLSSTASTLEAPS